LINKDTTANVLIEAKKPILYRGFEMPPQDAKFELAVIDLKSIGWIVLKSVTFVRSFLLC
jgi:hypothetical protein